MAEAQVVASGRKEQKASQWFGTGTSNNVPLLPATADRHKTNAQDCQDNGQDIITANKPPQRE